MSNKIKLFVVDDHPIVAEGLGRMISKSKKYEICGSSLTFEEALQSIKDSSPDILIIDISLQEDYNGIELLRKIKKQNKKVKALFLSMHDEKIYAERTLKAGAAGYVNKSEFTEKIMDAIDAVAEGKIYLSETIKESIIQDMVSTKADYRKTGLDRLTNREFEIFEFIGRGLNTKQIAEKLNLSEKTVLSHKLRIRNKFSLKNSNELVNYAIKCFNS